MKAFVNYWPDVRDGKMKLGPAKSKEKKYEVRVRQRDRLPEYLFRLGKRGRVPLSTTWQFDKFVWNLVTACGRDKVHGTRQ